MTVAICSMKVEDWGTTPEIVYMPDEIFAQVASPEKWMVHLKIIKNGECIFNEALSVEEAQSIRDKLTENIDQAMRGRGRRGH